MKQGQKGQTLIEVVAALTVSVAIVTALTITILTALNNVQFSKNQNLAAQYAQQGMEVMRQLRNSNWDTFNKNFPAGSYCLSKNSSTPEKKDTTIEGCSDGVSGGQNVDEFAREIDVITGAESKCQGDNIKEVDVTVSWADNKCTDASNLFCHSVKLVSCLSDYTVVPTP